MASCLVFGACRFGLYLFMKKLAWIIRRPLTWDWSWKIFLSMFLPDYILSVFDVLCICHIFKHVALNELFQEDCTKLRQEAEKDGAMVQTRCHAWRSASTDVRWSSSLIARSRRWCLGQVTVPKQPSWWSSRSSLMLGLEQRALEELLTRLAAGFRHPDKWNLWLKRRVTWNLWKGLWGSKITPSIYPNHGGRKTLWTCWVSVVDISSR